MSQGESKGLWWHKRRYSQQVGETIEGKGYIEATVRSDRVEMRWDEMRQYRWTAYLRLSRTKFVTERRACRQRDADAVQATSLEGTGICGRPPKGISHWE